MLSLAKQCARFVGNTRSFGYAVRALEHLDSGRTNVLRVLTYHRVDTRENRPHLNPTTLSATPAEFRRQMEYLANRYRVVSLDEVVAALADQFELPPRSVLLTFDDAYQDFAENAWPVLRELQLPAVMFVPTAFPGDCDRAFWWDRIHEAARQSGQLAALPTLTRSIKAMPDERALEFVDDYCQRHQATPMSGATLTWPELRRLAEEGLTLAPHTRTHPLLTRVTVNRAVEEALQSKSDLEEQIGSTPAVLAYPSGACSAELAEAIRAAGFDAAFTTDRGINDMRSADPTTLRRINVSQRTPSSLVYAQLLANTRLVPFAAPGR